MYKILIALATGLLVGHLLSSPTEVVELNDTTWCFHSSYKSVDNYHATNKPPSSFIAFHAGNTVVYAPCETYGIFNSYVK